MDAIGELIMEFIKEMLREWVWSNLSGMFIEVNMSVKGIAEEIGRTPSEWNSDVFTMISNLSDTVIVPIAGVVITFVLCYELITMVIERNNMHDFDTAMLFKYIFKSCLAVMVVSHTSDIVLAVFDIGNEIVVEAASSIRGDMWSRQNIR